MLNPLFYTEDFLKDFTWKIKGYDFIVISRKNKKEFIIGHYMSLSTSYHFKGTSYEKVTFLIYDEFLYDKSSRNKELKGEVDRFLNLLETIFRLRNNWRAYLLGNATTFETSYKDTFKLIKPFNSNIWCHKKKSILVELVENENFRQIKKQSTIGCLSEGLEYESYGIDNNFIFDRLTFIKKKSGIYHQLFKFSYNGKTYKSFISKNRQEIIIDRSSINDTDPVTHSFKSDEMLEKTRQISRDTVVYKTFKKYFKENCLYYQKFGIKNELHNYFMKNL